MKLLRKRIIRLLESNEITDDKESGLLRYILATKKFNPYCLRHSSICADSDWLPDYALKKKVRWSMNSRQGMRYIKNRMGDDLKEKILVQNGIISDLQAQKKPSVLICPRCSLTNTTENKYCSKCSYPLTAKGYQEIKEQENSKFRSLEERFNTMQSQMQTLLSTFSSMNTQEGKQEIAKELILKGVYKK
jgi:ribosomal protein L37E